MDICSSSTDVYDKKRPKAGRFSAAISQQPGTFELKVSAGQSQEYKAEPQTVVLELGKPLSHIHTKARPARAEPAIS